MADLPQDLLYSREHEYLRKTDAENEYLVGITDYAQGELGDVVFVELPKVGDSFAKMEAFGTIEAVKAVSELFLPVTAEVVEVNDALDGDPEAINRDPYGEGWMIRIRLSDPAELGELMDAAAYGEMIGS
jgi:glycine cleavage system H protein